MSIWIDADACPNAIKKILFRAAERTGITLTLIANQTLATPPGVKNVKSIRVAAGFDVADNEIVKRVEPDDLVITSDIPLAFEVIEKGGRALNPRGELYTKENIKARLDMRDFMDTLRASGVNTGGPPPISETEKRDFANKLDRYLTRDR